jgi:Transcriptional regulator
MLKTLDNALRILAYFGKEQPQWGVRELAKAIGMNHSVVYRTLATLEQHGFLIQDKATQKYGLGFKLLEYGSIIRDRMKVTTVIYPIMKQMAEKTGESVFLLLRDGLNGLLIECAESPNPVKFTNSVGERTPLYAGASDKVIMAHLSAEEQETIIAQGLKPITSKQITRKQLMADLEKIRQNGWCYTTSEVTEATFGIAAPLFNVKNQVIAAVSVSGPEYRMSPENFPKALEILLQGRNQIQDFLLRHQVDILLRA